MKYTPGGILKSYKFHYISPDGTTEHEFFIEKSILPFKLAVPNLYVYIAAGAIGLIVILIVGAIIRKKKK